jgi:hypothetical protein
MPGALLVTNQDVTNFVSRHQFVIEGHDRSAGKPKDVLDSQQL